MPIKVCHITSVHKRYDTRVFHKECTSLANAGYDVTLLVADNNAAEMRNGVRIISIDFKPKSRWDRILHSCKAMHQAAVQIDAEIYHFHDPELLPLAKKLKRMGKKVIFDSHENVPEQILNKQWIPKPLRRPCSIIYERYANTIISKIDYVIGVTPHLVEKLRHVNSNVEMITNFPILPTSDTSKHSQHAQIDHAAGVIAFAGGVVEGWSHEKILQAIENLDIKYKLAGPTDGDKYIARLKRLPAWGKVEYLGKIPHEDVAKMLQQSSIGMAVAQYSPNTNGKFGTLGNTKLFEYMAAGLPVICTDFSLWSQIIAKWHCGICVNPNDVTAIRDAIIYLIQNPQVAANMGINGHKAVTEEYNWKTQETKLLALYEKL